MLGLVCGSDVGCGSLMGVYIGSELGSIGLDRGEYERVVCVCGIGGRGVGWNGIGWGRVVGGSVVGSRVVG